MSAGVQLLLAGIAPVGRSLTPQDKGSLGLKKKLPDLVVSVTATGSKRMKSSGKKEAGQMNFWPAVFVVGAKRFELVTPCL